MFVWLARGGELDARHLGGISSLALFWPRAADGWAGGRWCISPVAHGGGVGCTSCDRLLGVAPVLLVQLPRDISSGGFLLLRFLAARLGRLGWWPMCMYAPISMRRPASYVSSVGVVGAGRRASCGGRSLRLFAAAGSSPCAGSSRPHAAAPLHVVRGRRTVQAIKAFAVVRAWAGYVHNLGSLPSSRYRRPVGSGGNNAFIQNASRHQLQDLVWMRAMIVQGLCVRGGG